VHAHVAALPLAWIKPGLAGVGSVDGDVTGTWRDPRLEARLQATLDGGGAVQAQVRAPLPVGDRAFGTTPLDGLLTIRALSLTPLWPELPLPVVLDGSLHLTGSASDPALDGQVTAHAATKLGMLEVASTLTWRTTLEATLQAGLDRMALLSGHGAAAIPLAKLVREPVDRDAAVSFEGTVDDVDLASRLPSLSGTLAGKITMRSTLAAPLVTAALTARNLAVAGAPLGSAPVTARLDRTGLSAVLQAHPPGGGFLNADVHLGAGQRRLHVAADRLKLAAANAQLRAEAQLDADVTIDDDHPRGLLTVSHGTIAWAGEPVEQALLKGHFEPGRLRIDDLRARVGNGGVEANGELVLDGLVPRSLALSLRTHELPLSRDTLGLWLDAEASLQLRRTGDGVDGVLQVARGEAHVVRAGAGRTLQPTGPLADVTIVGVPAAGLTPMPLPRPTLPLHLRIDVPGRFHIASQELDVMARASLEVDSRTGVTGRAEAAPGGHLELFDRRYDVDRAILDFAAGRTPEVDLAVSRELGEVLLTLEVHGPIDAPTDVRMVADPPLYDATQIGGLVAAGDPRADASTGQIGQRMVGVVTGLIAGRLRDRVAPALPVDVVKLEPGATAATPSRLEIGKFVLGDRVYVSYNYQFGGLVLPQRRINAHEAQVQLKLVRRLSLDARYGDAGAGALDLTFTLRR
jgi:autotransporter translocation and assembly factor TamB